MKIIIDTHIFLWSLADPARIARNRINELESPTNIIYVSSITIAELMIKASVGKLQIDFDPVAFQHILKHMPTSSKQRRCYICNQNGMSACFAMDGTRQ